MDRKVKTGRWVEREGMTFATPGKTPTLTVDDDDLDHGDGEEGQGIHFHLDQDGRQQEHTQDDRQTPANTQLLGDPGREGGREGGNDYS